jgi:hypothetical protein
MGGMCSTHRRKKKYTKILVGRSVGKRPLRRYRCRWEDNIRTDLKEIGWEDVDWMHLTHDTDQWRALENAVMNLRVS